MLNRLNEIFIYIIFFFDKLFDYLISIFWKFIGVKEDVR